MLKRNGKVKSKVLSLLICTLLLVFSATTLVFAAGGNGSGGRNGGGNGSGSGSASTSTSTSTSSKSGNGEALAVTGQFLTEISSNQSTNDGKLTETTNVSLKPTIKLVFNKNVVNSTVWANNEKCFSLVDASGANVDIKVFRIPDEGDNSNSNERQNIFITPQKDLISGQTYTINISKALKSNSLVNLDKDTTVKFTVKEEVQPIELTVDNPKDNLLTNGNVLGISGKTKAGYKVTVNSNPVMVSDNGQFTSYVRLNPDVNTINIIVTDDTGKEAKIVRTVNYDNIDPTVTVTSPANNLVTNKKTIVVSGSNEVDNMLIVNNVQAKLTGSGSFNQTVTLNNGTNKIYIIAVDKAGNYTVVERVVTFKAK